MKEETIQDYMDGNLSENESLKVQLWIAAHRDDADLCSWLDKYFDTSIHQSYASDSNGEFDRIKRRLGIRQPFTNRKWVRMACSALVLILLPVVGFLFGSNHSLTEAPGWIELNVPYGRTDSLTLSDGTRLYLNSGSKLFYPETFSGKAREIVIDGELMADVAPDKDHPFIIKSGLSTIKVTGTKFDFKSYETDKMVEIALLEGSVDYSFKAPSASRSVNLEAGNLMRLDKATMEINVSTLNTEKYSSFSQKLSIHFLDEPLSDIASSLERIFDTKIVILDEELAKRHFIAYFVNNESLTDILNALNASEDMDFARHDGVITISRI